MKMLTLLEDDDIVSSHDYCRPLEISQDGQSDYISFKSMYSGAPENNLKWARVDEIYGEYWYGKTVKEFNAPFKGCTYNRKRPTEFVRGDIPDDHIVKKDIDY